MAKRELCAYKSSRLRVDNSISSVSYGGEGSQAYSMIRKRKNWSNLLPKYLKRNFQFYLGKEQNVDDKSKQELDHNKSNEIKCEYKLIFLRFILSRLR